jgi:hypothetical protein
MIREEVNFDNTKIESFVPGFTATIPFKQGIKRTIDWFEGETVRRNVRRETNDLIDRIISQYENLRRTSDGNGAS